MIRFLKILTFFAACFVYVNAAAQTENPVLFTDRDFCVSGDTVWFKVWLREHLAENGNVVRVQLDGPGINLISAVASKNQNGWSEGFIPVPDSLSSGQYFLTAFLNAQRRNSGFQIESRSLIVYNRFEEQLDKLDVIEAEKRPETENFNDKIRIEPDKIEYGQRENVNVKITFNPDLKIQNALVNAALLDPLASTIENRYSFSVKNTDSVIPVFAETDGVLISGKVVDAIGNVQPHLVVVLSIAGDPPYFDYYFTGEKGDFHFFLKNTTGRAPVVLQVVSESEEEFFILKEENYLARENEPTLHSKQLSVEQATFIGDVTGGYFMHKLFNPGSAGQPDFFEMLPRFKMPFYGTPTRRVVPDEFIDLPDFQEISRELLHGFQYRIKKEELTFRMLDDSKNGYFNDEPLRLINGIPVFKNGMFAGLKSADIEYIDMVQKERIYGDLRFEGILSVVLHDKANLWMAQQPGVTAFKINCLQPVKKPGYVSPPSIPLNQPDIRTTYLWQIINPETVQNIQFQLADVKGKVEISVEGVSAEGKLFKVSKIIEVK